MITSMENARVKAALRLRSARERRRAGLFVAEGPREVERALAAGLVAREIFVAPELARHSVPVPIPPGVATTAVGARVLARLSYRAEPEGIIAVFETPRRSLPLAPSLVLVAVGIEKPGNFGAMARTAAAAGADALLVADARCDPWNPNAIRASTGAVFTLPVLETTREELLTLPLYKVAAVVGARTSYVEADLARPTAILIGAEDEGLDAGWRALADVEVSIPVRGRAVDSLNAGVAAALLLYEAVRRRDVRPDA